MADARKLAFSSFATPAKGVLVLFCEEGLKFGPAARKALAPTGDLVGRAAAARPVHRQKRQFARHRGAGRTAGGAAGDSGGGQGWQAQGAGSGETRRGRHGQGSSAGGRGRDLRGICQWRAQAGPGGRDRSRHAAARLCVRSLQDQAPRGRGGAGEAADHDRGEQRGGGQKGLGLVQRAGRRWRDHGPRPDQRARQCAVPGGVRPPNSRAQEARRRGRSA